MRHTALFNLVEDAEKYETLAQRAEENGPNCVTYVKSRVLSCREQGKWQPCFLEAPEFATRFPRIALRGLRPEVPGFLCRVLAVSDYGRPTA